MKKIKKALILAAGKGTRLWPISASTPKPLLKIKGTPIIENTINILISKGIETIYVAVGYRKDKFAYLMDKYKEVKLIDIKDYETTNTATALYRARKYLDDNLIILEGDLYIKNRDVIETKIDMSKYLYRPMDLQNTQWGFHLDYLTNHIKEVRKPEETTYLNNKLYGISFWLKEDLSVLVKALEKEHRKKVFKTLYFDEVVNLILDAVTLGVQEIEEKEVFSMKVLDDLLELDESYIMFKSLDLMDKVLGIKRSEITNIYDSPGRSLNNTNYVVEVNDDKYLLRIPGKGTELFNDRQAEKDAYNQLNHKNLVEEAYFIDPISGIKISKFYEGSRIIDATNNEELRALMVQLRKLHEGDYQFKEDNVFERMRRYDAYVASVGGRKYYTKAFKKIHQYILDQEQKVEKLFETKPIHADLSPNNVLVTKEGNNVLIDLEFISMGDPYTDIANFAHDGMYTPERTVELLEIYLDRPATELEKYKVLLIASAVSIMWYIWAVYKMAVEESDFRMYKSYRDQYLHWAILMQKASLEYAHLIKDVY